MHSLGNDFMVIDGISRPFQAQADLIARWGNRNTGIGFDQLLVIDPPTDPTADFQYKIYNVDGNEAEQCGNGTRCVTLLAHELGLTKKTTLKWQSLGGDFATYYQQANFATDMPTPRLDHADIPFDPASTEVVGDHQFRVAVDNEQYTFTPVSMGNPHAVLILDDIFNIDVPAIGAQLTSHESFPNRTNVGFCQVIDRQFVRLRVFERGVGETQACGTGACAAVVAAQLLGKVEGRVKVSLPGGKLKVQWPEAGAPVRMSGPATLSYTGDVSLS